MRRRARKMEQEDGGDSAALGMGPVESGEMVGAKPKGSFRRWADDLVWSESFDERSGTGWKSRWTASLRESGGPWNGRETAWSYPILCMYEND